MFVTEDWNFSQRYPDSQKVLKLIWDNKKHGRSGRIIVLNIYIRKYIEGNCFEEDKG